MVKSVEAVYDGSVIRPLEPLDIEANTTLVISFDAGSTTPSAWPPDFINKTYGILREDPVERLPQGAPDRREQIS